jgi:hypothetical protein
MSHVQHGAEMDDLNYLFQRQQEERGRADRSNCAEARQAHEQLAHFYEERISRRTDGRVIISAHNC